MAFAHGCAEHGYELVLTARRTDRLENLARELKHRYRVVSHVFGADLAQADAVERLTSWLSRESLSIDFLINNAGYGVPGSYVNTTWQQQREFLQVLVVASCELAHRLVGAMIERGWGRIINVASLAGLLPGVAGHTLYAASKAFAIAFSESLALETARHGVYVTASCPGFTLTEFHDVTGTRDRVNQMPKFMWLDAEHVARGSYDAVMRGDIVHVPGRVNRSMAALSRLLPRSIVLAVMKRSAGTYRKT